MSEITRDIFDKHCGTKHLDTDLIIQCNTKSECLKLLDIAKSVGYKIIDGMDKKWDDYKSETCLVFNSHYNSFDFAPLCYFEEKFCVDGRINEDMPWACTSELFKYELEEYV